MRGKQRRGLSSALGHPRMNDLQRAYPGGDGETWLVVQAWPAPASLAPADRRNSPATPRRSRLSGGRCSLRAGVAFSRAGMPPPSGAGTEKTGSRRPRGGPDVGFPIGSWGSR
jgi:hypothetical protein